MKPTPVYPTLSEKIEETKQTAEERAFTYTGGDAEKNRQQWQQILALLQEWQKDCSQFAEDDLKPPTAESLQQAERLAMLLSDQGICTPARVAPNGDGGIVFEKKRGITLERIQIGEDGTIEWFTFKDARLTERETFSLE